MFDLLTTVATSGGSSTSWIDSIDLTPITTMAESVAAKAGPIMIGVLIISAGFTLTKKYIKKASNG